MYNVISNPCLGIWLIRNLVVGVYAFSKGASVDFNDYNAEVLDEITIPNVLLNVPGGSQVESPAEKALLLKKRKDKRRT